MFLKIGFSILFLAIALIPTWFFLIIRNIASPEGFWQQVVIYGLGFYLLGGLQIVLIIIWIAAVVQIIFED